MTLELRNPYHTHPSGSCDIDFWGPFGKFAIIFKWFRFEKYISCFLAKIPLTSPSRWLPGVVLCIRTAVKDFLAIWNTRCFWHTWILLVIANTYITSILPQLHNLASHFVLLLWCQCQLLTRDIWARYGECLAYNGHNLELLFTFWLSNKSNNSNEFSLMHDLS